ncbi:MAG: LysR family transcriptional regulator [Anaerostipes sp.]|jgi:DNA-binding transcriptional LysR family regulator|nr:LysR family transcriptional regulator [Anaerostipes sp.]MDD3747529.1 LysR family transcriptional regulator [Anaerostipes sp.]
MTINQLVHFLEIAKCESFTKAAAKLYISQPAISKSVQLLEKDLEVKLIDRTNNKKFKLTDEGRILYERGLIAMEVINNQMAYLYDSVKSRKGKIIIGVPPVMGTACFTSVIPEFNILYPEIELNMVEKGANKVLEKVKSGELDIGAVMLPIQDDEVNVTPFISSENVLLVHKNHSLADRESVSFSELKNEKFILLDKTYMLSGRIKNICMNLGFRPHIIMESSQWDFIAEMVASNQGIGILPKPILRRFKSDNLKTVRLTDPTFPWNVALIVKNDKQIYGPLKIFIDFVKTYRNEFERFLDNLDYQDMYQ